jgi:integrase
LIFVYKLFLGTLFGRIWHTEQITRIFVGMKHSTKGRPSKSYTTKSGDEISGLYRRGDGRWIDKATGKTWTEPDEAKAVAQFLRAKEKRNSISLPGKAAPTPRRRGRFGAGLSSMIGAEGGTVSITSGGQTAEKVFEPHPNFGKVEVDSVEFWSYVTELFLHRPHYVAERTGIPQLATYQDMPMPGRAPTIAALLEWYGQKKVKPGSHRRAKQVIGEFVKATKVTTVRDIDHEALTAFKAFVGKFKNETQRGYYRMLKAVISWGLKGPFDETSIRGCLDRLAKLHTEGQRTPLDPNPITPAEFRKLVGGADYTMRAYLLLSLNCCMYNSEALSIEWDEIDLEQGVFASRRGKTGIRRAATLWPETVEAVKAIERRAASPYMFTSSHGSRFNVTSFGKRFVRLRKAVKVEVEHNQIRDGAYTAAVEAGVPLATCQFLAGHKMAGQVDNYVARAPKMVRGACDAVRAAYAPFPASVPAVKIGPAVGSKYQPRKLATV